MEIKRIKTNAKQASNLLKLLSNEIRLLILCNLIEGKKSVSELESIIKISQSALSQHLAKLKAHNIIEDTRKGQLIFYSIIDKNSKKILETLYKIYCK
ncbi:MAG: metalloregulator ArsR/SmtB family transcription factor [Rickettsiales bacterium]|nr:metalloregulator ArsR/SmtB family transcription factor [Rickettsiales bacterium]